MMGIEVPETCWTYYKCNKPFSGIWLVFRLYACATMHGQTSSFMFGEYLSKIVPFYEIMWKNNVEPDGSRIKIWRMCIAWWVPNVTNTHSEYVLLFHYTKGYTNMPQCYVIRTLLVLFKVEQVWKDAAWKVQNLGVSVLWIHTVEDRILWWASVDAVT